MMNASNRQLKQVRPITPNTDGRTPPSASADFKVCLLIVLASALAWVTGVHAVTFGFNGNRHSFGYLDVLILTAAAAGLIACAWGIGRLLLRSSHRFGLRTVTVVLVSASVLAVASLPLSLPTLCITYESSEGAGLGVGLYCSVTSPAWQQAVQGEFVSSDWLWDAANGAQILSMAVSIGFAFALAIAVIVFIRRHFGRARHD